MRIVFGLAAVVVAVVAASGAYAQEEVIKARQAIMQVNQRAAEIVFKMAQGQMSYDPAIAAAALLAISNSNDVFPTFFPEGSDTGTAKARPSVWSDRAAFVQLSMKMTADAKASAEGASTLAGLQAGIGVIGQNCAACHRQFRME